MSRVTIGELIEDVVPFTEESDKIIPIEIIPRKIAEDTISECMEIMQTDPSVVVAEMARGIKNSLERRLKAFEEGNYDSNNQ